MNNSQQQPNTLKTICTFIGACAVAIMMCSLHVCSAEPESVPAPQAIEGTYRFDKEHGLVTIHVTAMGIGKDKEGKDILVLRRITMLNVVLVKEDNEDMMITFVEDDSTQAAALKKCTVFKIKWSEADKAVGVVGYDKDGNAVYKCGVKDPPEDTPKAKPEEDKKKKPSGEPRKSMTT